MVPQCNMLCSYVYGLQRYGQLNKSCLLGLLVCYPLAQQSCGGDIGSVPYVCM